MSKETDIIHDDSLENKFNNTYLEKTNELNKISNELTNFIADKLFNIMFAASILKGAIIDYQKGNYGSEINKELLVINHSIAEILKNIKSTSIQVETHIKLEPDKSISVEVFKQYHSNLTRIGNSINDFNANLKKEVIDKMVKSTVKFENEHLMKLELDYIVKWHNELVSLLNIGFNYIKKNKISIKLIDTHINEYKVILKNEIQNKNLKSEMVSDIFSIEGKNKIKLSHIKAGSTFTSDLYDENGKLIKTALQTIENKDIENMTKDGIQYLYLYDNDIKTIVPKDYKLLIIDDNTNSTNELVGWIKEAGFKVLLFNTKDNFKTFFSENKPDIIFLELFFPHRDDFIYVANTFSETNQKNEDLNKKTQIILLFKSSDEDYFKNSLYLTELEHIIKPLTKDKVILKINQVLMAK